MKFNYGNNLGAQIPTFEISCLGKEVCQVSDVDFLIIHILQFERQRLSDLCKLSKVEKVTRKILTQSYLKFRICVPHLNLVLPKRVCFSLTSAPASKGPRCSDFTCSDFLVSAFWNNFITELFT